MRYATSRPDRPARRPASAAPAAALLALLVFAVLPGCGGDEPRTPPAAPQAPAAAAAPEAAAPPSEPAAVAPAAPEKVNAVAMVNGRPVFMKEFELQVSMRNQAAPPPSDPADPAAAEDAALQTALEVLENLVTRQVAVGMAIDGGFEPSEDELEEAIDQIAGNTGGREEFNRSLEAFGMSFDELRTQVAETMAVTSWRDMAFLAKARVTEEEARAFYEANIDRAKHDDEVRGLQIMIPIPLVSGQNEQAARDDARARAEAVLQEAKDGADFGALIERHMDQATRAAVDNGRLGWVSRGLTGFPELEEVLFSLKPGEVGGLVESPFSFHVVKVLETRPAGTASFEELKPDIYELLADEKIDQAVHRFLVESRRTAEVVVLDPELAAAWPAYQARLAAEDAAEAAAAEALEAMEGAGPAADVPAPDSAPDPAPAAGAVSGGSDAGGSDSGGSGADGADAPAAD